MIYIALISQKESRRFTLVRWASVDGFLTDASSQAQLSQRVHFRLHIKTTTTRSIVSLQSLIISSDQSNLTTGRIAVAYGWFNGIRQVTPARTPSNTCFLGPTRIFNPNGILIGSAVFAALTIVTDRQTDRPRYSVCNNRPYNNDSKRLSWLRSRRSR